MIYRFADLQLDTDRRELFRETQRLKLTKLSYNFLEALVVSAPAFINHEDLIVKVWGSKRVISQENLAQRARLLRASLGETKEAPVYIETVYGQGFRLIPDVVQSPSIETPKTKVINETGLASEASPPVSLAVLPFQNLSSNPDQNFLVEGITRDLTELLSLKPDANIAPYSLIVQCMSSGSSMNELAQELEVRYLVSGGIEQRGDRFRLRISLEDALAGSQVWSKHFDEPISSFYEVQDQLEQTISMAIGVEVDIADLKRMAKRGKFDLSAYELIQQTEDLRRTYNKDSSELIVKKLQELVLIDPDNAVAHAHLAIQLSQNLVSGWYSDYNQTARMTSEHLDRARASAPEDPRILSAAGIVSLMTGGLQEAVDLLSLSLAAHPNDPHVNAVYGLSLARIDQIDEGLAYINGSLTAAPRHPRCAIWWTYAAATHFFAGRVDEAWRAFDRSIKLNPGYFVNYIWRAFTSSLLGNLEDVHSDMKVGISRSETNDFKKLKQGTSQFLGATWSARMPWDRLESLWREAESGQM